MFAKARILTAVVVSAAIVAVTLVATTTTWSDPPSGQPKVFARDSAPYGMTYGDWSAAWWQWAYSLPAEGHPLFDETGEDAGAGQSGPVFYLCGVFNSSGTTTRTITVPRDKALFFPILNVEWDNFLCIENTALTLTELRAAAAGLMDTVTDLVCELDGHSVHNLKEKFRVFSPVFEIYLAPDGICADDPPTDPTVIPNATYPAVGDGVYVMLKPLPVGEHTLHFTGTFPTFDFTLDITYHITIAP